MVVVARSSWCGALGGDDEGAAADGGSVVGGTVQAAGGATFSDESGGVGSAAGGVDGLGGDDEGAAANGRSVVAGAVQAAGGATFSGESSSVGGAGVAGVMGGAGVARRGDAEAPSHGDADVEGSGPVTCGMDDGGVAAGGVDGLDRDNGERVSSSSSSWSRSSSSSFRRRLGFLAGGGSVSGEGGVAGGGVERVGGGKSAAGTAATAEIMAEDGDDDGADSSHTAVAARPRLCRRRWRRLLAAVSVTAGTGMLHETVKTWDLAACLIFTLAFRPLATQRWYRAEKSAADTTAGCDPGQDDPTRASPLTTLAHVGEPGEVEVREEVWAS
jgi:hypothetical protein